MFELATKKQSSIVASVVEEQPPENDDSDRNLYQPHFVEERNAKYEVPILQSSLNNNSNSTIKRKLLLLSPLLLCLYILTDTTHRDNTNIITSTSETTTTTTLQPSRQHLAFVTALSRHPPALRVFRIVSESAFLLFCAAFALWVWETCRNTDSNSSSSGSVQQTTTNCTEDSSLEEQQASNSNITNTTTTVKITIPSQSVGKLLFSPPPDSITDNAAWMVYQRHREHRLLFRSSKRKRRKSGQRNNITTVGRKQSNDDDGVSCNEDDDLIELQQRLEEEVEDEEDLVSPLMMDTPLRDNRLVTAQQQEDEDDEYTEHDQNGNTNGHHHNTETTSAFEETTLAAAASSPPNNPPSSTSVLGAALDITTFMCMFLIFFTISSAEGGRYIDHKVRGGMIDINPSSNHHLLTNQEVHDDETQDNNNNNNNDEEEISYMKFFAKIAAPLFPITLFLLSTLTLIIPWRKRKALWTIVSLTLGAPFYEVTFRDGFIGDILTSTVRPLQDLAYTVVFLFLGLQSWWDSQAYNPTSSSSTAATATSLDDVPLERSWLLHTFILPACTLSPLWWRFLQNLRQCFDNKQRWPYLGNAFKYMLAAEVAIFGMFDPSLKKHPVWILCFFVATLYQVWWDVFMDWGLLEWNEDEVMYQYYHSNGSGSGDRRRRRSFFWWWPYKLRSRRAYPHRWIYYTIFILNFCLRFVGMLTLIPPVYLSRRTGLIVNTWYDPDFQLFVGSLAAISEIFRRTIWALLRLEWEVIKTSPSSLVSSKAKNKIDMTKGEDDDLLDLLEEETDMKPMAISSSSASDRDEMSSLGFLKSNGKRSRITLASLSDMSNLNGIQILSELCAWATIFSGVAIIAAAHREIL